MELKEFCKFVEIKYSRLLFCFILIGLRHEPPKWNDVEPIVPCLISKGVPTDDVKHFDQLCHLEKFAVKIHSKSLQ